MTKKTSVAIQGKLGSFHDEVTKKLNPNAEIHEKNSFVEVFEAVLNQTSDLGVVAFENINAGVIQKVQKLFKEYAQDIEIIKETSLRVEQCLIGLPNANIETIKTIQSHPVALAQCNQYTKKYETKEANDTASAVQDILENNDVSVAAIASANAAKIYGGNVLESNIQNIKNNDTSFFVIRKKGSEKTLTPSVNANRTALQISTKNQVGSLQNILQIFKNAGINISLLYSFLENQNSVFHLNLDQTLNQEQKALLEDNTETLKVLGEYNADAPIQYDEIEAETDTERRFETSQDKKQISFELSNTSGSLLEIVSIITENNYDMKYIDSNQTRTQGGKVHSFTIQFNKPASTALLDQIKNVVQRT